MNLPDGMTPEALRAIADWLDFYDDLALSHFGSLHDAGKISDEEDADVRRICTSREVQQDLRRWAGEIEAVR